MERRILDNLATAVILFDRELRVRYLNPSAEMLLAASARHVIGHQVESLLQCPGGMVAKHLTQAMHLGQPLTEREIHLSLMDGRQITVDCTVIPVNDWDGDDGGLAELQQVDRQLRMNREEQLLNQQSVTRDLIRGMAHEIKNPLGGLRGAAQLLEAELHDPSLREYTQIIIREADRLQTLMNRMLGPNRRPEYRRVNIHQVLERVRSLVSAETGGRIQPRRDYDPSIPDLWGDSDQLIQAVLNIVRNAARAVAADRGQVWLRTRIQRQFTLGNQRHRLVVQVDIRDNGPGIPEEILDRIFFPMVTGGTGGMGLGLSFAQSLINQHKGLIECSSQPGDTVFTIYLPVESGHE